MNNTLLFHVFDGTNQINGDNKDLVQVQSYSVVFQKLSQRLTRRKVVAQQTVFEINDVDKCNVMTALIYFKGALKVRTNSKIRLKFWGHVRILNITNRDLLIF